MSVPPPPPASSGSANSNKTLMLVLCYFGLLALIPLLTEKDDAEVQWHAKHGLVLAAAEILLLCVYIAITSLVSLATSGLGCVLALVILFAWVAILVLHVVAIIKGIGGARLIVPGVSAYANRF